jgi:tripartite-type tricarboxylate transporter receptor subunit TctC
MRCWSVVATVALVAAVAFPGRVSAQDYPTRTVKIIVPFAAGGSADVIPRLVAEWLSRKWGQSVIVENRTGASGNIGADAAAKADPDGYTLLSSPPPPLVINQNLFPKLGFDPTALVPIVVIGRIPNALVVNPRRVAAGTIADVIAMAKSNGGTTTVATTGNGGTQHLTSEMFQMMAGVKFQHVPYRGSAPALSDLVAGNVDMMFDNLGASMQLIKGGQIKLLAVAAAKRMAAMPDVPAIAETLPGFEAVAWFAVVAPPKTPMAIVNKINADINEALRDPDLRKKLENLNAELAGGSQESTAAYFRDEIARWNKVIKDANVKLDL